MKGSTASLENCRYSHDDTSDPSKIDILESFRQVNKGLGSYFQRKFQIWKFTGAYSHHHKIYV